MVKKNRISLLIKCLIGCWAVLYSESAFAANGSYTIDNETKENLKISSDPDSDYDKVTVKEGGILKSSTVSRGGVLNIDSGELTGSENNKNKIELNGVLNVYNNGTAKEIIVSGYDNTSGGKATVNVFQADVSSIEMNEYSSLNISKNGVVTNISVGKNASVTSHGSLDDLVVNGGSVTISGSTASNGTMSSGNIVATDKSEVSDIDVTGGTLTVKDGTSDKQTTATDITVRNDGVFNLRGHHATASGTIVSDGGKFFINSDDTGSSYNVKAYDTIVYSGGTMSISGNQAGALNISLQGGSVDVTDKALIQNISANGGGIYLSGESSLLTPLTGSSNILSNDSLLLISGKATAYDITLDNSRITLKDESFIDDISIKGSSVISAGFISDPTLYNNNTRIGDITLEENSSLWLYKEKDTDGASVENIVVNNGATLISNKLYNGGDGYSSLSASTITVQDGGKVNLSTNDQVSDVIFNSNDPNKDPVSFSINGNQANSVYLDYGSKFTVKDNGKVLTASINGGSSFIVETGGNASDITIDDSSSLNIEGGSVQNADITGNSTLNISSGSVQNVDITGNSTFNVEGGSIQDADITGNSTLTVSSGGTIKDVLIDDSTATIEGSVSDLKADNGATLDIKTGATVNNLILLGGTNISVSDYESLSGNLTIGKDVLGLDASNLFNPNTKLSNLTLIGGLNPIFTDGIINSDTATGHYLTLEDGFYDPAEISGWSRTTLNNATLSVNKDINFVNNGALYIDSDSSLLASGDIALKQGSLRNYGTIDLTDKNNYSINSLTIDGNYVGVAGSKLNLDINISSEKADKIIIGGKASGTTDVYLNISDEVSTSRNNILFAQANDASGGDVFKIQRVAGSYYEWDTVFDNNKWYASLTSAIAGDKYIVVPEAVAYYGLIDNTFMQTSSLGANLRNNIAISEYKKAPCKNVRRGFNTICKSNQPLFSGWLAPATSSVTVESPYVYDAEINGFDGGLDLLSNGFTKLGLLVSYRKGTYNYEENGEKYIINGQAETSINSYLAGAYLRHDSQKWSTILAGYAGIMDVDISTDDDINSSTSGTVYGATLDVNYIYKNISGLRIEPGVRISYTAVEMDPIDDYAGKTQEFDNASRTEIETGIRFAKRWDFAESRAEMFVKPSIVYIMDSSSDFVLDKTTSFAQADNRTVAKIEAGLSFDMTSSISASLAGSYSVGDDYTNTTGNLSVMYKF